MSGVVDEGGAPPEEEELEEPTPTGDEDGIGGPGGVVATKQVDYEKKTETDKQKERRDRQRERRRMAAAKRLEEDRLAEEARLAEEEPEAEVSIPVDHFGPGEAGELPSPTIVPSPEPAQDTPVLATDVRTNVIREALVQQHEAAVEDLLRQRAEGEISSAQYERKMDKLEAAHIDKISRIDERTAPKEWYYAADEGIETVKAGFAAYATETTKQILELQASGKITEAQAAEMISQVEAQNIANLLAVDEGDIFIKPFDLFYTVPGKPIEPELMVGQRPEDIGPGTAGFFVPPLPQPKLFTIEDFGQEMSDVGTGSGYGVTTGPVWSYTFETVEPELIELPDIEYLPGPGKGPKVGSIGYQIKTALDESFIGEAGRGVEEWGSTFAQGLRTTSRETLAIAQARWAEGDEAGALLPGVAAIGVSLAGSTIEELTFPFRPAVWGRALSGLAGGAVSTAIDPVGSVKRAAKAISADPLLLADIASALAVGWVGTKGVQALTSKVGLSRVEQLDIDVKQTTLGIEDVFVVRKRVTIPEVDITGTAVTKRLPKIAGEIVEAELRDLARGKTMTVFGIEQGDTFAIAEKIDIPTSALDDILKGKGTWLERQRLRLTGKGVRTTTVPSPSKSPGLTLDVEFLKVGKERGLVAATADWAGDLVDVEAMSRVGGLDIDVPITQPPTGIRAVDLMPSEAKELAGATVLDDISARSFTESAEEAGRLGTLKLDIPERDIVALRETFDDVGMRTLEPIKRGDLTGDVFKYTPPREPTDRMILTEAMDGVTTRVSKVDVLDEFKLSQIDVDRWLSAADEGPPVDFQSLWSTTGRKGILEPGLHEVDVKGWEAKLDEVDVPDDFEVEFIARSRTGPSTPYPVDVPEPVVRRLVPKPSKPTSAVVVLDDVAEKSLLDEITAGAPPPVKPVVEEVTTPPPGLSAIAARRAVRMGPPSRFDAPDMPSAFPVYKHTTKGVMPNPFALELEKAKDKADEEIKRRTVDRKKAVEVPKPVEALIPDIIFDTKLKPKAKPEEEIIFKPKADVKPIAVPDVVYDVKEKPAVVPAVDIDEILKQADTVLPVVVPKVAQPQKVVPIVVPIPVEKVIPWQPHFIPPPRIQVYPVLPFAEEEEFKLFGRRDFGVKQLGRTLRIGVPRQALRGIFGPLRPLEKQKKKKKDEEEDFFSFLFGRR